MALLHVWRPDVTEISSGDYDSARQQDLITSDVGGTTWMAGGGRFGEDTMRDNNDSTSSYLAFDLTGGQRDWDQSTGIYICTSFKLQGAASSGDNGNFIGISDSASITPSFQAFRLQLLPGGRWYVNNEAVERVTIPTTLSPAETQLRFYGWNTFEMYITPSATAGLLTLKVNGVTIFNAVDIGDTGTAASWNHVLFWGPALNTGTNSGIFWGDTVIMDGSGSEFNGFLGDFRMEVDSSPTADGTTTAWTSAGAGAAYVEIDDTLGAPDDDTTYIESTTAAQDSFVTYAGASLTNVNTISGVLLGSYARESVAAAPQQIAHRVDSSSTFATGTTYSLLSTYELVWDGFEQNPNTSTAWTKTTIDAAEWGVQSIT